MVRPIEISDSLSKVQAVERMQQEAKLQPEVIQQFTKTLAGKQTEKLVTTSNPVAPGDQVVLHIDEQEKEKRKTAEDSQPEKKEHEQEEKEPGKHDSTDKHDSDDHNPPAHIDIKV
jgi:flagellar basal body L-ring protein FlgH